MIQNHALQDWQCLVSGNLDNKPIFSLIDTGSSISLLDGQLYYSLSLVPLLQPIPFSVSGADGKPQIALRKTFVSIAIDSDIFWVQLVVTKNILLPVVLGIDFLQTHVGVISFPTNQLYLTNPSPKPNDSHINTNHTHNTHTPPMHTRNTYHLHPRTFVHSNQPYHMIITEPVTIPPRRNAIMIITEPVTIPPRRNTIMTIPCDLPVPENTYSSHLNSILLNNQFIMHLLQSMLKMTLTSAFYQPQWPRSCYPEAQLCWSHGKSPRIRPTYVLRKHFPRIS